MGKNKMFDFKLFNFWTGSGRGQPPGTVRVDPHDVPLKYGPGTTSRSKVIKFTVHDFFGGSGEIHRLFPTSCF